MGSPSADEEHLQTLELINDELTSRLSGQDTAVSRIETKATVVLGFAAAAAQFLAVATSRHPVLVPFGLGAYALAFLAGIFAFKVTGYKNINAAQLRAYAEKSRIVALRGLIAQRTDMYQANVRTIRRKVVLWWYSVIFFAAGLTLSTVALVHTGAHG